MKVLMISRDAGIMQEGSVVQKRMAEYGALADEVHIVVFTTRIRNQESGIKNKKVSSNVFVYPTNSRNKWFYIYDAYKIAAGIIVNWKVEIGNSVVTVQDPFETGVVGWLATRKYHVPLQVQVHTDFMSPYFARESLLNKIRVRIAKFLLPRADAIRVVSERIKKSLKAKSYKLKADPVVLPIFSDVQKIKDASIKTDLRKKYQHFDFIALMASRFTKEKNIPMAISAMAEVIKKHPKAGLIIVGSGPEEEKLKAISYKQFDCLELTAEGLKANVVFEPWTDDLASYYKTSDIFVLTSDYEGYGRTIIEAEAAERPVIMTDVGIAGDVIKNGENGLVVPVGDTRALIGAILSVIEKKAVLSASLPKQPSKEEYLDAYRASWENTLNS